MYKHYLIDVTFKDVIYSPYNFIAKYRTYLEITEKDIKEIVSKKYQATINTSEFFFKKTTITELEYGESNLDKYSLDVPVRLV